MVNFAAQLQHHAHAKWQAQYVKYQQLKDQIEDVARGLGLKETDPDKIDIKMYGPSRPLCFEICSVTRCLCPPQHARSLCQEPVDTHSWQHFTIGPSCTH